MADLDLAELRRLLGLDDVLCPSCLTACEITEGTDEDDAGATITWLNATCPECGYEMDPDGVLTVRQMLDPAITTGPTWNDVDLPAWTRRIAAHYRALLDRLEAAEARVRELEGAVAHTHTTAPGTGTLTHTHRKGDVPHGHHGWRYGAPVPEEPEGTPAAEPYPTRPPQPAEERLTDLMAALAESVEEAKEARARKRHRDAQAAGLLPCPKGCGCITAEDPDARDCACDGPCCFGEDWPIAAGSAPESEGGVRDV